MPGFLTCPHGHGDYNSTDGRCPSCMTSQADPPAPSAPQEDFLTLSAELDKLVELWHDRDVSIGAVWSILAATVLAIAKDNEIPLEKVLEQLQLMWETAEEAIAREATEN